jgi:hypothetical protein
MTPTIRRLVAYLFDAPEPPAELAELPDWLAASRFRSFAEANRDKIRKKVRGASSAEARLDVRAELRVASLLLADRRFELAFEAYGAGRRGPDFTVTFRAGRPFNLEVTRRQRTGEGTLERVVLAKLRQLPPSTSNVIVVAVDGVVAAPDPGPSMRALRGHADRVGLLRLATVIAWAEGADARGRIATWSNADARIPLPEPTRRALLAALQGDLLSRD